MIASCSKGGRASIVWVDNTLVILPLFRSPFRQYTGYSSSVQIPVHRHCVPTPAASPLAALLVAVLLTVQSSCTVADAVAGAGASAGASGVGR